MHHAADWTFEFLCFMQRKSRHIHNSMIIHMMVPVRVVKIVVIMLVNSSNGSNKTETKIKCKERLL